MTTVAKRPDRRIVRTRQLLQQAFREVYQEKSFAEISVQDITERANVNRGTFYAHFTDKYALLDTIIRQEFQELLERSMPPVEEWNRETLHLLIQLVLEYMQQKYAQCASSALALAPLIERATQEEITTLLSSWLAERRGEAEWRVPESTLAHVISWAIFGAARQRCQETARPSAQFANEVLLVIMEGVSRLAPNALD